MLPRTLEPEVMDSDEEAREYDAMNHADVNAAFVDDLLAACERNDITGPLHQTDRRFEILDCGTGTARIPIVLAGRMPQAFITAIDLSASMLTLAEENVRAAGLASQIVLRRADGSRLPYDDGAFDVVISNSTVHHLPDPLPALAEMRRLVRPGGLLFVRDLVRPSTRDEIDRLVAIHAAGETPTQQQLLRDSLHAALTLAEIREFVRKIGLPESIVRVTSDRHWTLAGAVPQPGK